MKKGPEFEKEVLEEWLVKIWPAARRRYHAKGPGNTDLGDYDGIGNWIIDAKKRDKLEIPAWIRNIRSKAGSRIWAIIFASDRRRLPGTYVIMPVEGWLSLMRHIRVLSKGRAFVDNSEQEEQNETLHSNRG